VGSENRQGYIYFLMKYCIDPKNWSSYLPLRKHIYTNLMNCIYRTDRQRKELIRRTTFKHTNPSQGTAFHLQIFSRPYISLFASLHATCTQNERGSKTTAPGRELSSNGIYYFRSFLNLSLKYISSTSAKILKEDNI
jgi:hypothetical protein